MNAKILQGDVFKIMNVSYCIQVCKRRVCVCGVCAEVLSDCMTNIKTHTHIFMPDVNESR